MSTKRTIARATILILALSLASKAMGFVREIIIAAIFGTTYRTDAYFIGIMGPDFIREMVSGGVLTAVFIPIYSSCLSDDTNEKGRKYLNSVTTLIGVVLLLFVAVGIPLAPYLVKAIAPELDPATFALSVSVTRLIFPSIFFMGIASLYGSLLNVYKHFLTPSLNQLVLNVAIIAGVLLLGWRYGVQSLAVGFLVGAILQFVVLLPALKANKIEYRPSFCWNSDEMKKMYQLWLPLFVALFVSGANDLVNRSIAAGLPTGNVAALNFANRIRETVWLLCGVPLGTAIFPYISLHAANNEKKELKDLTYFAIRITVFMAMPLCLLMLFYSKPLVRLLFQRGMFDANSTAITSQALVFYSMGALFYALNYVILRVYFSVHNTRKPLIAFIVAFVVNIGGGVLLRRYMSLGGITLARSLADFVTFAVLVAGLPYVLTELKQTDVYKGILKIGVLAFVSVASSYVLYSLVPMGNGLLQQGIHLLFACALAITCYIMLSIVFKVGEVLSFWNIIRKKLA